MTADSPFEGSPASEDRRKPRSEDSPARHDARLSGWRVLPRDTVAMAEDEAATLMAGERGSESLSQFTARVLNQLSVSAWLPSAALVLSVAFVIELAASLDARVKVVAKPSPAAASATTAGHAGSLAHPGVAEPLGSALHSLADISVGGALLLLAAVVVLTMLTQAFSFEAIRTLEGYWSTRRAIEWWGGVRSAKFNRARAELDERLKSLKSKAWHSARQGIEAQQDEDIRHNRQTDVRGWTADKLSFLGAALTGQETDIRPAPAELPGILAIPWRDYAPPELLRRYVNLDKAVRDLPRGGRALPTRLGNVLRAHEDQIGRKQIETMVQDVYDEMPPSLQGRHNENRDRLDLYCSMVFVLIMVAAVGWARLGPRHWNWAAVILGICVAAAWLMYRAAIASARAYGLLLLTIAKKYPGE
jgi:hypothetical protein